MIKIYTSVQMHELDKYTIEHLSMKSVDLMEKAATEMHERFRIIEEEEYGSHRKEKVFFAGPGNNGGDALALARLMAGDRLEDEKIEVFLFNIGDNLSEECRANRDRLRDMPGVTFTEVTSEFDPPTLTGKIVFDGLFGSGLNRPLTGGFASLVKYINDSRCSVMSIDVPSGLMTEDNTTNVRQSIVRADITFTFHTKKLAFFFAENQELTGRVEVLDIGILPDADKDMETSFAVFERTDAQQMLRRRNPFANKGDMGHALLIAGQYGMAGAAVLASRACMRAGAGKVTVVTPSKNNDILQISVPEVIVRPDNDGQRFSQPVETEGYDALGIGPGIGQDDNTGIALIAQLRRATCPIVADADALNILANRRAWLQQLPQNIILTPHPKEMDRLAGNSNDSYERLCKAVEMAKRHRAYIVLKGHHTAVCTPDGSVTFNSTGNAGMATAGSGDVLTGIITALLTRGYQQKDACLLGVYLHGLAGDFAADKLGMESLVASDIISALPQAFNHLNEYI